MLDLDYKVLKFLYRNNDLKVGVISKELGIPHSTIGSCIKRLEDREYVIYHRYKPVILSSKGRELAIELTRHARLLELLLINELKMNPTDAHSECEKFHLLLSCSLINKICQRYGHPKSCPCGEVILSTSGCFCEKEIPKIT
jgi:DtxR family Mn-dependent transcriptional regulator